jgi:ABC-2 type transport system permease protein
MFAIYRKELSVFLSSLIGFVVLFIFLALMGLLLWVVPEYSILDSNYASLDALFDLAPTIFMFLIPAITMRSLAEEIQTGTIELLVTKPLSDWQIVLGKFFATLTLVALVLLPTVVYYYSVYQLGLNKGNLDSGGIMGSYIGLFCLAGVFCAIGVFASSLTANQIISFILATFLCFFFYSAFDLLSKLPVFFGKTDDIVQKFGIAHHYASISRGVVDTRDVVYFLSVAFLFLSGAVLAMSKRRW